MTFSEIIFRGKPETHLLKLQFEAAFSNLTVFLVAADLGTVEAFKQLLK